MRFPRQEYRSRLPGHPPGDFPHPGIEPQSPALGSGFFTAKPATRETQKPIVLQLKIGKCNELTCKVKNNSKVVAFFKLVYQVLTLQATHPLSFLVWRGGGGGVSERSPALQKFAPPGTRSQHRFPGTRMHKDSAPPPSGGGVNEAPMFYYAEAQPQRGL